MNQISDPPNRYGFGLDFDYAVWTAESNITLTNVPWNNDYRDVVSFENTAALNAYIDRSPTQNVGISRATYAKANEPILLDVPFNVANTFNYVRVHNPAQPINGGDTAKYFYYFIVDVQYIAPNTTQIVVQLDIFQTFIRQVEFGRCFIERGHIGIANEANFRNYGRDYLTVPEGLDTGETYTPIVGWGDTQLILPAVGNYSILVASSIKLEGDPGTLAAPNLNSAEGGVFQGMPSGASYYIFLTATDFTTFMRTYSNKPWVTQGIMSITVIPRITRYYGMGDLGAKLPIGAYKAPSAAASKGKIVPSNGLDWRDHPEIRKYVPPRLRHLKKIWTSPYMFLEMTTFTGQSSIIKPEFLNSDDIVIKEEVALLPPNQRLSWYPDGYNSNIKANTNPASDTVGTGADHAVSIAGLPSLAIVNNGAILAMANTARGTAFGYQSADWSQQKALRGNEVSYDQASSAIQANTDLTENSLSQARASLGIGNQASSQQAAASSVGSAVTGAGMGAFAGPAGAVIGGIGGLAGGIAGNVGALIQANANNQQYAAQALGARGAAGITGAQGGYLRDTNKSLSDYAARGDYENTIAGLNAQTADRQLTPPSVAGQVGGELLGMLNFRFGYFLRVLMPDQAHLQAIGEIWLRYGYSVNRFGRIPNNLMVMDKFTYWKLKETYIRAARLPENIKQGIRGLLEKGVTVWGDPDDIGMIDTADNRPLPGITLEGYEPEPPEPDIDPEPPITTKKRKRNMIVFSAVDDDPATPGNVWALAGSSPGTDANWIETRNANRALAYQEACGVEAPVGLTMLEFESYRDLYRAPVSTKEMPEIPE